MILNRTQLWLIAKEGYLMHYKTYKTYQAAWDAAKQLLKNNKGDDDFQSLIALKCGSGGMTIIGDPSEEIQP